MAEAQLNGGNGAAIQRQPEKLLAETKHERFLRLATQRVQRALDALHRVGQLSLPENEYGDDELRQIVTALRHELDDVERRLKRAPKAVFEFDFDRAPYVE